MTDFNSTVDTIMSSFKDEKKNRWTGKTPDGDVWAAGLMPSRKELVVILYDKMRGEEKTIRIKDTEKDKLISTFRELYDDSRKSNKEDLGEDTVYDHSWYEVEKQKYPKRTKEGVIVDEMSSCGATSTCSVGSVPSAGKTVKSYGKISKRKRKISEDLDSKLFKESILNDMPCESTIAGHSFKYFMNEGKWYMGVDNCLVKTHDKNRMMETFDQIVDEEKVTTSLLEDYSCYEMDLLMEEDDTTVNPTSTDSDLTTSSTNADMNSENLVNAAYAHEAQQAVDAEEDSSEIKSSDDIAKEEMHNQEILGNNNGEVAFKNDDNIETGIQKDSKTVSVTDKSGQNKDIEMVTIQKQDGKEIMLPASEVDKVK